MNKKIITSLLAAGFAMSSLPVLAKVPEEIKGTKYEEPVSVLAAFKIMNGDENGEFRLDDTIIRSEVTKMAVTALGMQDAAESSKGNHDYLDVSEDHWANGYISIATGLGLVEGDGDGNFRPNDKITYREAVTIMVRATGYEQSALQKGGYPSGYISVASENAMLNGVSGTSEKEISRGNVAVLTNNALETKKMEQTGFGDRPSYSVVDKTLLSDNLSAKKITGQIKAVGKMTLSGVSPVNDDSVMIGNEIYKSEYNANDLLGHNVIAYVQKDKYNEEHLILALSNKQTNTALDISPELFRSIETKNGVDVITYYEGGKSKTASIASNAQLIYNNRNIDYDKAKLNIQDKNAYISLLDTNSDSKYDVVFVTEYENIIVESATSSKITGTNQKVIRLDDIDYKLYQGFNEIRPTDLRKWDVISVVKSPTDDYHEIYMSRNTVKGKVTSITKNGFKVDGTEYITAAEFDSAVSLGDTVEFCLDVNSKISAIKNVAITVDSYGYLTNAYTSENGDTSYVKLVEKSGEKATLELASKVKFNGVSTKAEDVVKGLEKNTLIAYVKNSSNNISEIDTAIDKSNSGTIDTDNFTLNKKLEAVEYNSGTSKLGDVRITNDTIVFDASNIDNISVGSKSLFADKQKYTGLVYDMTEKLEAGVVVITETEYTPDISSQSAVVIDISSGLNNDGEDTDIVTLLVDGKETTLNAKDKNILVKGNGAKLDLGDIIQYKTNSKGEIAGIRVLLDIDAKDTEFINEPIDDMTVVYGKVEKVFDDSLNVSVNGASAKNYEIDNNVRIYSIDSDASIKGVEVAEFGDIAVFDEDDNNRIFIRIVNHNVKEVIIVK
ncbi:MAG: S-layer homology domain-containing protein [Clostridiales bacterium]|nr:S-layer homology domain-containing protein [Clostridiales bacterium]